MGTQQSKGSLVGMIVTGAAVLLLLAAALVYLLLFHGKVASNPAGTVGNTAGNLNNSGLFCEYNGIVYFANPNDGNALYAMNPDESEPRKLYAMSVRNILAGGNYLYYFQIGASETTGIGSVTSTHSFNRCDLKGNNSVELTRDVIVNAQLVDDYLYLLASGKQHPQFFKMKIDKTGLVNLAAYNINPSCARNGVIYYNGMLEDHALYSLNTANDVSSLIANLNLWNPVLDGDYIYYMDVSANYRLSRYSLSDQTVERLTSERVDCFNVGSGYIYYQTNDAVSPQLKCMHTDGSNAFTVADGIYNNINMTSQYVYFQQFGVDGVLFHAPLGGNNYSFFR